MLKQSTKVAVDLIKTRLKTFHQNKFKISLSQEPLRSFFSTFNEKSPDLDFTKRERNVNTHFNHFVHSSPGIEGNELARDKLSNSFFILPNFISESEETDLVDEVEPYLKNLIYEDSHWDDAIHNYRETEFLNWNTKNERVIKKVRETAFESEGTATLRFVHVLDLAKDGVIKSHVDSVRFCGNVIAGLSLLSDCVMRLRLTASEEHYVDAHLPRFSLYIMKDHSRYDFSHEILGGNESVFKGAPIVKNRRISIICRNEPKPDNELPTINIPGIK